MIFFTGFYETNLQKVFHNLEVDRKEYVVFEMFYKKKGWNDLYSGLHGVAAVCFDSLQQEDPGFKSWPKVCMTSPSFSHVHVGSLLVLQLPGHSLKI